MLENQLRTWSFPRACDCYASPDLRCWYTQQADSSSLPATNPQGVHNSTEMYGDSSGREVIRQLCTHQVDPNRQVEQIVPIKCESPHKKPWHNSRLSSSSAPKALPSALYLEEHGERHFSTHVERKATFDTI